MVYPSFCFVAVAQRHANQVVSGKFTNHTLQFSIIVLFIFPIENGNTINNANLYLKILPFITFPRSMNWYGK